MCRINYVCNESFIAFVVLLPVYLSANNFTQRIYWSDRRENFTGDVWLDNEVTVKFWTSSASALGFWNFWSNFNRRNRGAFGEISSPGGGLCCLGGLVSNATADGRGYTWCSARYLATPLSAMSIAENFYRKDNLRYFARHYWQWYRRTGSTMWQNRFSVLQRGGGGVESKPKPRVQFIPRLI